MYPIIQTTPSSHPSARRGLSGRVVLVALMTSLLAAVGSAHAQTYIGAGGVNCAKYNSMTASNDPIANSVQHWLLGYASGANMLWKAAKGTDKLINIEAPQVLSYVGRYCTANPNRNVLNGVNDYFFSLPH